MVGLAKARPNKLNKTVASLQKKDYELYIAQALKHTSS